MIGKSHSLNPSRVYLQFFYIIIILSYIYMTYCLQVSSDTISYKSVQAHKDSKALSVDFESHMAEQGIYFHWCWLLMQ